MNAIVVQHNQCTRLAPQQPTTIQALLQNASTRWDTVTFWSTQPVLDGGLLSQIASHCKSVHERWGGRQVDYWKFGKDRDEHTTDKPLRRLAHHPTFQSQVIMQAPQPPAFNIISEYQRLHGRGSYYGGIYGGHSVRPVRGDIKLFLPSPSPWKAQQLCTQHLLRRGKRSEYVKWYSETRYDAPKHSSKNLVMYADQLFDSVTWDEEQDEYVVDEESGVQIELRIKGFDALRKVINDGSSGDDDVDFGRFNQADLKAVMKEKMGAFYVSDRTLIELGKQMYGMSRHRGRRALVSEFRGAGGRVHTRNLLSRAGYALLRGYGLYEEPGFDVESVPYGGYGIDLQSVVNAMKRWGIQRPLELLEPVAW